MVWITLLRVDFTILRVDSTLLSLDFHSKMKWSLIWLLKEWISAPAHLESINPLCLILGLCTGYSLYNCNLLFWQRTETGSSTDPCVSQFTTKKLTYLHNLHDLQMHTHKLTNKQNKFEEQRLAYGRNIYSLTKNLFMLYREWLHHENSLILVHSTFTSKVDSSTSKLESNQFHQHSFILMAFTGHPFPFSWWKNNKGGIIN